MSDASSYGPVPVVTADGAAARDAAAIAAGTSSLKLMQTAGTAAAEIIVRRLGAELSRGVVVLTGAGNNGGDGWIVAGDLARRGVPVRVDEVVVCRSPDALAAKADALSRVSLGAGAGTELVVVDALLGTGSHGDLSGGIAEAVRWINGRRHAGASVVALDIPTGVGATHGAGALAVMADLTISFGTVKRGHLLSRDRCGVIVIVDIGHGIHAHGSDGAAGLVDERWVAGYVPAIDVQAHKGRRRRVLVVGGSRGMAGAAILASKAAMRSGVGLVKALVEEPSLAPMQSAVVEATAATWPLPDDDLATILDECHAVLVGPGLGRAREARGLLEKLLELWSGPTVLDADAINLFEDEMDQLARLLARRPALLTPHVREFGRLAGLEDEYVIRDRFDVARDAAHVLGASILLKGVPTVITAPTGESMVSATGTPVLAAAGSGDILAGIAVTLLAQAGDPFRSGAAAAWVHGRAGEIANAGRPIRGVTVSDVIDALAHAWRLSIAVPAAPLLGELPAVGEPVVRVPE